MTTSSAQVEHPRFEHHKREFVLGESVLESIVGVAAVVLAIVGLLGSVPLLCDAVAMICGGAALLLEGGAVATRMHRLSTALGGTDVDISGGLGAESIAGVAAVVLGILSLLGCSPLVLLPVSAIILGAGLMLGSAATARLHSASTGVAAPGMGASSPEAGATALLVRESIYASSGAHVLVGLAAITLGIVALLGLEPRLLTLVAALSIGGGVLLSGAAVGGRLMLAMRH
jgi:hypothetical protein